MSDESNGEEEEVAHYVQSGWSVISMGVLAFGLYAFVIAAEVELGFIEAPAVLVIGGLFLAVGSAMVHAGSPEAVNDRRPSKVSKDRRGR